MSVYKRGEIYWVHVAVGGLEVRRSARTKDKKKAEEYEARVRTRLYDDWHSQQTGTVPKRKFDEALERWLLGEAKALRGSKELIAHTRQVRPYVRGIWLTQGPDAADRMKATMLHQGLKPATINQRLAVIRRVLNLSFDWGWLKEPLGKKVKLLNPRNERHLYLTPQEVDALADAAGPAKDAVLLAAYTGLRRGELLSIGPGNKVGDCIILDGNTKSGKPRVVPLPAKVAHIALPLNLTANQLRVSFEKARTAIGRPDLHLHDLRHTYASLLIQSGASLTAVRDLLGHAHVGVTSRYSHLADQHLRAAVTSLDTVHLQYSEKQDEDKKTGKRGAK